VKHAAAGAFVLFVVFCVFIILKLTCLICLDFLFSRSHKQIIEIIKHVVLEARDYVDRAPDHNMFIIRQKGVNLQYDLSDFMRGPKTTTTTN
jgi:hypothetical protein